MESIKTIASTKPKMAIVILFYGGDKVVGQAIFSEVDFVALGMRVIVDQTVGTGDPDFSLVIQVDVKDPLNVW